MLGGRGGVTITKREEKGKKRGDGRQEGKRCGRDQEEVRLSLVGTPGKARARRVLNS